MCVFLISPVPIAEPLTSELIDTPVFYNLAPRPIKYRVSVPIPSAERIERTDHNLQKDALRSEGNMTRSAPLTCSEMPEQSLSWKYFCISVLHDCVHKQQHSPPKALTAFTVQVNYVLYENDYILLYS